MNKKTFRIVALVCLLLVIIFGIWFFFLLRSTNQTQTPTDSGTETFFPVTTTFAPDDKPAGSEETLPTADVIPALRQISSVPTAGGVSFERTVQVEDPFGTSTSTPEEITETVFRYIERATGHMYETTERTLAQIRLSNTTIPRIYDALFSVNGNNVILRFLTNDENIETYRATLVPASTTTPTGSLEGSYFENNIKELVSDGTLITYLRSDTSSNSQIFSGNFMDTPTTIHSNTLSRFILDRPSPSTLTLTTKADSRLSGSMFLLNPQTGLLSTLIKDALGLTTLTSPNGDYVLYNESESSIFRTNLLEVQSGLVTSFNVNTMVEKCVWSRVQENIVYCGGSQSIPFGLYPQSWYQGKVSFTDDIWKIDVSTQSYQKIFDGRAERQNFDIIKPMLSTDDEYFLFINKNDLTLWSYDLKQI